MCFAHGDDWKKRPREIPRSAVTLGAGAWFVCVRGSSRYTSLVMGAARLSVRGASVSSYDDPDVRPYWGEQSEPAGCGAATRTTRAVRRTIDERREWKISEGICPRPACNTELDEEACPQVWLVAAGGEDARNGSKHARTRRISGCRRCRWRCRSTSYGTGQCGGGVMRERMRREFVEGPGRGARGGHAGSNPRTVRWRHGAPEAAARVERVVGAEAGDPGGEGATLPPLRHHPARPSPSPCP
jgi:hypothetical protein